MIISYFYQHSLSMTVYFFFINITRGQLSDISSKMKYRERKEIGVGSSLQLSLFFMI